MRIIERLSLQRKIGFHMGLDLETLRLLIENKVVYEAFSKFAAETLRRRLKNHDIRG
ncbi:hypothetical protein O3M35_002067 [Rhynocoris fuscipes]|uniref:Uncharacterized protein n=1 Tax=Rhynocoris fuscipes TaxID=488301 RepID=A0AAW1CRG1_9HEMI